MSAALMIGRISLSLDVRLADDTAVFVELLANEGSELCAAYRGWKEALRDQLRAGFGRLYGCGEPVGQLSNRFGVFAGALTRMMRPCG
jgi:hypothetical protein